MSKIIIKCFKVNEVWNFYDNVISYEHYFAVLEEKYNELIKKREGRLLLCLIISLFTQRVC